MNNSPQIHGDFCLYESGGRLRLGLAEAFIETLDAPAVSVELADAGARIKAGDTFGFLQTSLGTHDLRAPFALHVLAVNGAVLTDARLAALSPTGRGWLAEIKRL